MENNNQDQMLIKPEWIKRTDTLVEENNLRKNAEKRQEGSKNSRRTKKSRDKNTKR